MLQYNTGISKFSPNRKELTMKKYSTFIAMLLVVLAAGYIIYSVMAPTIDRLLQFALTLGEL